MTAKKDLLNQPFGRLTVIVEAGRNKHNRTVWECFCTCGNIHTATSASLLSGNVTSCGCYQRERSTKHGKRSHPHYKTHTSMMHRCYNINDKSYNYYVGRGITVCERWHDVSNYIADVALLPGSGDEIDKIDNNSGYSLENCRLATRSEQLRNTCANVLDELTVIAIKHLIKAGCRNCDIASELKVSRQNVAHIRNGRTWADISIDY